MPAMASMVRAGLDSTYQRGFSVIIRFELCVTAALHVVVCEHLADSRGPRHSNFSCLHKTHNPYRAADHQRQRPMDGILGKGSEERVAPPAAVLAIYAAGLAQSVFLLVRKPYAAR